MSAMSEKFVAIQGTENCMAYRNADGIEVALLWYPNNPENEFEVWAVDHKNGSDFNLYLDTGKQALFAYHHPFVAARNQVMTGRVAA